MAHADGGDGVTVIRRLAAMPPAIVPPAPGRFSTMNCWPRAGQPVGKNARGDICSAARSNPIKTWTGFGQSCANAEDAAAVSDTAIDATIQVRFTIALPCQAHLPHGARLL
jgi:hypothetical protein